MIFNELNPITYRKDLGKIYNKFESKEDEIFPINFYSRDAGTATLKVLSPSGLVLKTITHNADKGLNFFNYDMSIDESTVNPLKTEQKYTKKIRKADDGKFYWIPGKYTFELSINGTTEKEK